MALCDPLTTAFERMRDTLVRLGRRSAGVDEEEARDCVQEAFSRLWPRRGQLDPARMGAIISVTVRNAAIDMYRRRQAHPQETLGDNAAFMVDDDNDGDSMQALPDVLSIIGSRLSPMQRRVLMMRDRDGYEMAQIAEATGLTQANVRMTLSRARRLVRDTYLAQHKQL